MPFPLLPRIILLYATTYCLLTVSSHISALIKGQKKTDTRKKIVHLFSLSFYQLVLAS